MNDQAPAVPAWFQNGFHRFLSHYLKRHFHAVAIDRESRVGAMVDSELPLIVYGNHPSWWDPLIAHFLNRKLFAPRQFYAPIDAEALEHYRVFGRLGFFGVRMNSTSGAGAFLKQSQAILRERDTALWLTPEGRFADARDHSAELMPGLAHLCKRVQDCVVLPLALEYVFWEERLPVCLAKLGKPIVAGEPTERSKSDWSELLHDRLRSTQRELEQLAIARSSEPFENLLRGARGVGAVVDSFRRLGAMVSRREFRSQHGEHFQ